MNADAFRHFYEYHFAENRKIWDTYIMALSQEQFIEPVTYSVGSVRDHIVHMLGADDYWFSGLRGLEMPEWRNTAPYADRALLRAHWDIVEQNMRDYLTALRDEMLFQHPLQGGDEALTVWQIMLQVGLHGADHRAQLLRRFSDLGFKTGAQDYIFYVFDHL